MQVRTRYILVVKVRLVLLLFRKFDKNRATLESKMPSFCSYGMCQNLASSSWGGYCNQYHYERGLTIEKKILEDAKTAPQDKNPKLLYCREEVREMIQKAATSLRGGGQDNRTSCGEASKSAE